MIQSFDDIRASIGVRLFSELNYEGRLYVIDKIFTKKNLNPKQLQMWAKKMGLKGSDAELREQWKSMQRESGKNTTDFLRAQKKETANYNTGQRVAETAHKDLKKGQRIEALQSASKGKGDVAQKFKESKQVQAATNADVKSWKANKAKEVTSKLNDKAFKKEVRNKVTRNAAPTGKGNFGKKVTNLREAKKNRASGNISNNKVNLAERVIKDAESHGVIQKDTRVNLGSNGNKARRRDNVYQGAAVQRKANNDVKAAVANGTSREEAIQNIKQTSAQRLATKDRVNPYDNGVKNKTGQLESRTAKAVNRLEVKPGTLPSVPDRVRKPSSKITTPVKPRIPRSKKLGIAAGATALTAAAAYGGYKLYKKRKAKKGAAARTAEQ
jgi:hypothetical protein